MKRKILLAISVMTALSFCACGGSDNTAASAPITAENTNDQTSETVSEDAVETTSSEEDESGSETAAEDSDASDVSRFYGYGLPLVFSFDHTENPDETWTFDITDKGSYFLVKGRFICPEIIEMETVHNANVGDTITAGSGQKYTVTAWEETENSQRQILVLSGEDGEEYRVPNIPAFSSDIYTGTCYYKITSPQYDSHYVTELEDVTLKIDADTELFDKTFGEVVRSGFFETFPFPSCYASCTFDINFDENGNITVFKGHDLEENNNWADYETAEVITKSFGE